MFCSRVCRVHSGGRRSLHQAWASSLSLVIGMVAPDLRPPSHRAMCSSDRCADSLVLREPTTGNAGTSNLGFEAPQGLG